MGAGLLRPGMQPEELTRKRVRRVEANANERNRIRQFNAAMTRLRQVTGHIIVQHRRKGRKVTKLTTIKAAILYILQLKRMLREEAAITEEEVEERERREMGDEQEKRKLNDAVSSESPSFHHSTELEKLPSMAVLKPAHDIQYLEQDGTTMHCCVKSEGCQDESEDFLLLEEGGVIRVLAVEKRMMVPVPLVWGTDPI